MVEGSTSSSKTDSVESKKQGKDLLTPEDVAWADSCLIKDNTVPASNWDSLLDALADIGLSSSDKVEENNIDELQSGRELGNPFLPSYDEGKKDIQNADDDDGDASFAAVVVEEPSSESIFKVWDLGVPEEEDELVKQLNKALSESSLDPLPHNYAGWKYLKDRSIDDLVAGFSDLSLGQDSG